MDRLGHLGMGFTAGTGDTATHLDRLVLPGWSGPAKATIAVAIAATALAPGVAHYVAQQPTQKAEDTVTAEVVTPLRAVARAGAGTSGILSTTGSPTAHQDARLPHQSQTMTAGHDEPHDSGSTSHETVSARHPAETSDSGASTSKHSGGKTDSDSSHSSTTDSGSRTSEVSHPSAADSPTEPTESSHTETQEADHK